jgi:cation transport ATPase
MAVEGTSCDSCRTLIERVAAKNGAEVKALDVKTGSASFVCDEEKIDAFKLQLAEKGFRERKAGEEIPERGDPGGVIRYVSSILAGKLGTRSENRLLNHAISSAAIMVLLSGAFYKDFFGGSGNPLAFVPILFLTIFCSIAVVFSYYHMKQYRSKMTCTLGMMVGMTVGMMAGFMIGAIVGATNGMFVGSVAGVVAGVWLGGSLGRHCGTMGALEGVMAGLMAGLMGAMTAVMSIGNNILPMLGIISGVSVFTLAGLSYMMYREQGPAPGEPASFKKFALASLLLAVMITALMLFGPKSGPVYS